MKDTGHAGCWLLDAVEAGEDRRRHARATSCKNLVLSSSRGKLKEPSGIRKTPKRKNSWLLF